MLRTALEARPPRITTASPCSGAAPWPKPSDPEHGGDRGEHDRAEAHLYCLPHGLLDRHALRFVVLCSNAEIEQLFGQEDVAHLNDVYRGR